MILGAATTFLAGAGVVVVLATPFAVAVEDFTEVALDVFATTVGSDDGIGFPNFVCNFNT